MSNTYKVITGDWLCRTYRAIGANASFEQNATQEKVFDDLALAIQIELKKAELARLELKIQPTRYGMSIDELFDKMKSSSPDDGEGMSLCE